MAISFDKMKRALKDGKVVALEKDKRTGKIRFGGVFENDTDAIFGYTVDNQSQLDSLPEHIFIKMHHISAETRR